MSSASACQPDVRNQEPTTRNIQGEQCPRAGCALLKSGLHTPKSCRILSNLFRLFSHSFLCQSLAHVVAEVFFVIRLVSSGGNSPQSGLGRVPPDGGQGFRNERTRWFPAPLAVVVSHEFRIVCSVALHARWSQTMFYNNSKSIIHMNKHTMRTACVT